MFEDWSPALHERRTKWQDGEASCGDTVGPHAPALTRPQLRRARCLAVVASLAAATLGAVSCQHLGQTEWPARAPAGAAALRGGGPRAAAAAAAPFNASSLQGLDHLVMVAGHAVVLADSLEDVGAQDDAWYLEDYQRGQDLPAEFVGHIRLGVETAAADARALLVFSGGQTRPAAGPRDEGSSYHRVAEHYDWWGHSSGSAGGAAVPVSQRTVTEDFAADSFQNLLFSLCRFKEVVGQYPSRITVVSFSFKRQRFQDLHRRALRLPPGRFSFVGSQPSAASHFDLARAERGERENALRYFETDPYGCQTPALAAKRDARNPFRRTTPYPLSCPDIRGLFAWCGPGSFPDTLPWEMARLTPAPT